MLPAAGILSQVARQSTARSACLLQHVAYQLSKSFNTVIMPEVPDWETKYRLWQLDLQNKHNKVLPEEFTQPKTTYDQQGEDGQQWQPAPRTTEADAAMDTKSLWRRLDRRLFLLVKTRGEAGTKWQFPQAEHQEGETMRQTAERALQETIQEGPQTYFVGNLPIGHVADSGYKAFFHKAQLIKGEAALKQDGKAYDFAWVAKDELPEYIVDEPHQELMSKVLGS